MYWLLYVFTVSALTPVLPPRWYEFLIHYARTMEFAPERRLHSQLALPLFAADRENLCLKRFPFVHDWGRWPVQRLRVVNSNKGMLSLKSVQPVL